MNFRNRIDIFYPFFGFLFTLHIFKFFRQRNRLNPLNISNNRNSRRHYDLTKIIFATLLKKFILIWRLQPLIVAFQSWLLELAWKSWQVATFFEWRAHQLVWPRRQPQTICTGIKNHTVFLKRNSSWERIWILFKRRHSSHHSTANVSWDTLYFYENLFLKNLSVLIDKKHKLKMPYETL